MGRKEGESISHKGFRMDAYWMLKAKVRAGVKGLKKVRAGIRGLK